MLIPTPLDLDSMSDVLAGFAIQYKLPPHIFKLTRQLSAELFKAAADNCDTHYDELLSLKEKTFARGRAKAE